MRRFEGSAPRWLEVSSCAAAIVLLVPPLLVSSVLVLGLLAPLALVGMPFLIKVFSAAATESRVRELRLRSLDAMLVQPSNDNADRTARLAA